MDAIAIPVTPIVTASQPPGSTGGFSGGLAFLSELDGPAAGTEPAEPGRDEVTDGPAPDLPSPDLLFPPASAAAPLVDAVPPVDPEPGPAARPIAADPASPELADRSARTDVPEAFQLVADDTGAAPRPAPFAEARPEAATPVRQPDPLGADGPLPASDPSVAAEAPLTGQPEVDEGAPPVRPQTPERAAAAPDRSAPPQTPAPDPVRAATPAKADSAPPATSAPRPVPMPVPMTVPAPLAVPVAKTESPARTAAGKEPAPARLSGHRDPDGVRPAAPREAPETQKAAVAAKAPEPPADESRGAEPLAIPARAAETPEDSAKVFADRPVDTPAALRTATPDAPAPGPLTLLTSSGRVVGPAGPGEPPPQLHRHHDVGRQLAHNLSAFPAGPVEVTLAPEELGHVRMTLAAADGQMVLTLTADRPETVELMRRHIDQLAQDFRDLGFRDLSFSFAQRHPDQRPGAFPTPADAPPDAPAPAATAPPVPERAAALTAHADDRLDLRL